MNFLTTNQNFPYYTNKPLHRLGLTLNSLSLSILSLCKLTARESAYRLGSVSSYNYFFCIQIDNKIKKNGRVCWRRPYRKKEAIWTLIRSFCGGPRLQTFDSQTKKKSSQKSQYPQEKNINWKPYPHRYPLCSWGKPKKWELFWRKPMGRHLWWRK